MRSGDELSGSESRGAKTRYLRAISNPLRRRVLDILQIERRSIDLQELTRKILEGAGSRDDDEAEEVRIALYHQHLPHLAEAGLVEFDEQDHSVEITEKALGKLR